MKQQHERTESNRYPYRCLTICPPNIYLSKVNNRNTRNRHEIHSELTIKAPEQRQ